jgi:hypothetical protein
MELGRLIIHEIVEADADAYLHLARAIFAQRGCQVF